jgi:hypothetical protein
MSQRAEIVDEFEGCELGDLRLVERAQDIAMALEQDPSQSLPELFEGRSELEAAYRFFGNANVELADALSGHVSRTVERAAKHPVCLAIHDTTDFSFQGNRRGLGRVDRCQQGFYAHFCLAVAPGEKREPLGVLAIDPWTRPTPKGKRSTSQRQHEPDLESRRWLRQSQQVECVAGKVTKLIHVEDREGDIYASLASRTEAGVAFVVRAQPMRVAALDDGAENILVHMRQQPRTFSRDVGVSARKAKMKLPKAHPSRGERTATLSFACAQVALRRPLRLKEGPPSLALNAIHVIETSTCPDGEERVEWLLYTSESIATPSDVERVVDYYRSRWVIEEYFKALKTGCAYESRQLESLGALLCALGVFAVVAWRMLWLRHLQRCQSTASAASVATPAELAVLRAKGHLGPGPATVADFLSAVAVCGGHLKNNGDPGLKVLWRGLQKVIARAEGWELAKM